jgi:Tfp pilus assembly protein PilV
MDVQILTEHSGGNVAERRWRRRRRIGFAMLAAGAVIVLGGLWIGVTALMARSELNTVRAQAHTLASQLSASKWTAARSTAASIASNAHRANQLTSGPVWALAAAVPSGGEPLQSIRGIAEGVDSLSHGALPQLVSAGQRLDPTAAST